MGRIEDGIENREVGEHYGLGDGGFYLAPAAGANKK